MPRGIYQRRPFSHEHREAISVANRGEKHPRWIKNPGCKQITTMKRRIIQKYGRANACDNPYCEGKSTKYVWCNISGSYKFDRNDWNMSCGSCAQLAPSGAVRAAELFGEPDVCEKPGGCRLIAKSYRWYNKKRTDCDFFDRGNWMKLCNWCFSYQKREDRRIRAMRFLISWKRNE